jgi:hypothetical protein
MKSPRQYASCDEYHHRGPRHDYSDAKAGGSFQLKSINRALGGVTGARNLSRDLSFAKVVRDQVRQAKADTPLALLCPVKSMAPVLAIAGMVANVVSRPPL